MAAALEVIAVPPSHCEGAELVGIVVPVSHVGNAEPVEIGAPLFQSVDTALLDGRPVGGAAPLLEVSYSIPRR